MPWVKNGVQSPIEGANDFTITFDDSLKFNVLLFQSLGQGATEQIDNIYRGNGLATNLYANRFNLNGATDVTQVGQAQGTIGNNAGRDYFIIQYFMNIDGEEKLFMGWYMLSQSLGAGTAPSRAEGVFKQITSTQLNSLLIENNFTTGSNDYSADTQASVLGTD